MAHEGVVYTVNTKEISSQLQQTRAPDRHPVDTTCAAVERCLVLFLLGHV